MTDDDDNEPAGSVACFAHRLVDGHVIDPQTRNDVAVFRKAERARLYGLRKQLSPDDRSEMARQVSAKLDDLLGDLAGRSIAVYWPIRGELNLRHWMEAASHRGAQIALPVVVEKNQPVEFHLWTPGCEMIRGTWNIPVPANPLQVQPDVVIVPLLGVDAQGYRLGNGGGYYDRTLARLPPDLMTIGVGQTFARMKTIFPMPWDIPMKKVVLGDGTVLDLT